MAFAEPPYRAPLVEALDPQAARRLPSLLMGFRWVQWLSALVDRIDLAPRRDARVTRTAQGAAIGTTPIPRGSTPAGRYQLAYYLRVTTVAGVSAEAQLTLTWTIGGQTHTFTGALMNGNTLTTYDQGVVAVWADRNTAISYAVSYVSNPAGALRYALDLTLAAVAEDEV